MIPLTLDAANFVLAPPPQTLADDEIHLWFFPQWEESGAGAESPEVLGLLAAYLGVDAAALRIERSEHGKPRLVGAHTLEFNLAHSGGALLLGVSRWCALGVDLEAAQRKTRPLAELARRWFAPHEAATLGALPPEQQHAAFLRLWAAKEALVKAQGTGIGAGLQQAVFEPAAQGWICADPAWQTLALIPDAAHIGALAWRGPVSRVGAFVAPTIAPWPHSG